MLIFQTCLSSTLSNNEYYVNNNDVGGKGITHHSGQLRFTSIKVNPYRMPTYRVISYKTLNEVWKEKLKRRIFFIIYAEMQEKHPMEVNEKSFNYSIIPPSPTYFFFLFLHNQFSFCLQFYVAISYIKIFFLGGGGGGKGVEPF